MDQAGPQMESIDIADNRLSGCERTTTTTLHVGQTYICWIPKMHNFDVPHASKTVNHAPTQSEVHEAYYIWWSPSPSLMHIICSYRNTTQKESSSMVKLINLSRCISKWCACINDGLMGPQMEASHVSVLARICMWPKKVLCDVWITNFTILMWHVPRKPKSPDIEWGILVQWMHTYSIYASPLPPLRRVLYTTITQTKKILPC